MDERVIGELRSYRIYVTDFDADMRMTKAQSVFLLVHVIYCHETIPSKFCYLGTINSLSSPRKIIKNCLNRNTHNLQFKLTVPRETVISSVTQDLPLQPT